VQETLGSVFTDEVPERLVGDKAYDSDPLDAELSEQHIEMIAPPHKSCKRKTQGGRPLWRAERRWNVERTFVCRTIAAWLSAMSIIMSIFWGLSNWPVSSFFYGRVRDLQA
jgi:hypothetical protein